MTSTLEQEIAEDVAAEMVPTDKLDRVRAAVRAARDLGLEISDLREQMKLKNIELYELIHRRLPELFVSTGVRSVGLAPEGNLPGYKATLSDYFHANIASSWEAERQEKAYDLLEKTGRGDLIKRTIEIKFGRKENKLFARVYKWLRAQKGLSMTVERSVSWNTLTAMIRETYEDGEQLGSDELHALGATVGQMVNIKEEK